MDIGNRIRTLRESKGLTQLELSKELNVARQTIAQWENEERNLKTGAIISLSKYFNVSADYLLGLSDIPHKSYNELANDYSRLLSKIKQFKERFSDLNDYVNKEL